jgi:hypothetical protein
MLLRPFYDECQTPRKRRKLNLEVAWYLVASPSCMVAIEI